MLSPLNIKLWRDLSRIKGQAAAIGLVIALGVLMMVMMKGLVNTLDETRLAYYDRYRLADIFVPVTRAPERMLERLAALPGVAALEGRVSGWALIDIGADDCIAINSMPTLCALYKRRDRRGKRKLFRSLLPHIR